MALRMGHTPASTVGGEATVLVVVDDSTNRHIIEKFLHSAGGHSIVHASNGLQALGKTVSAEPALILCDVMMGDLS